jgi:hypothetical protein
MSRNISIYYGRKIRLISNNNTRQKLVPDPIPPSVTIKHIRIPRKNVYIKYYQKNIISNFEKIWKTVLYL